MRSLFDILEFTKPLPNIHKYSIYCDMDGVLTNFDKQFITCLNQVGPKYYSSKVISSIKHPYEFEEKLGAEEFWKFIDQYVGLEFWTNMEWMPQGKTLWNYIKKFNPSILSSPSEDNASRLGKKMWVRNNLPENPKVLLVYSSEKRRYATPTSILIDDRDSNIKEWIHDGGIGLQVVNGNITPVIRYLKNLENQYE